MAATFGKISTDALMLRVHPVRNEFLHFIAVKMTNKMTRFVQNDESDDEFLHCNTVKMTKKMTNSSSEGGGKITRNNRFINYYIENFCMLASTTLAQQKQT